jgi:hypothetical protein
MINASTSAALYVLTIGLTVWVLILLDRLSVARRRLAEMTSERDHLRDHPLYPRHPGLSRERETRP